VHPPISVEIISFEYSGCGDMKMTPMLPEHTKLGFIGIGAMGLRIAARLLKHGFPLMAYDRSAAKAHALIAYGATVARSIAELASSADVVMSSLASDKGGFSVYTGPQGVMAHIRRGSMTIEMSTVSPLTSRAFYRLGAASNGPCRGECSCVNGSVVFQEQPSVTKI
jgi:hypothetical protein